MNNISTVLSKNELDDLELFIDSYNNKLLTQVFLYHKERPEKDFVNFYIENRPNDYLTNRDTIHSTLRTTKSRLQSKLAKYHLKISKDYLLEKININSDTYINANLKKITSTKDLSFEKIIIFDTYIEHDKIKMVFNILDTLLDKSSNNVKINILSNFHNAQTRDYYYNLMEKNKVNTKVKYMRESLISNSSIIFCLLFDTSGRKHLYYNESISDFLMMKSVKNLSAYDLNFFNVLTKRFNHYFYNKQLLDNFTIIDVELDFLKHKDEHSYFTTKIKEIVVNIKIFLDSKETDVAVIEQVCNRLIGDIKKIKILFVDMRHSNILLYSHVRISELLLYLQTNTNYPNSRLVLKEIIDSGLSSLVYSKTRENIKGNKFRFRQNNIKKYIKLMELRTNIATTVIVDEKTLLDIYPNFRLNTLQQVKDSLNNILINKEYHTIVDLFLKEHVNINIFIKSSLYKKLAFRAIIDIYLGIRFTMPLHLSEEQLSIIDNKLTGSFKNPKICQVIQGYRNNLET